MYLQTLRGKLAKGVYELQEDSEFQERFGHDPVLDELDREKVDYALEKDMTFAALGFPYVYKGTPFNHLKAWHLALLWSERSPIIDDITKAQVKDYDYFFWLLDTPREQCINSIKSTHWLALHYLPLLKYIPIIIERLMKVAFYPLTFVPQQNQLVGGATVCYDFDWLMQTIHMTGYKLDYALDLPMCVLTSLFVQKLKGNPQLHVGRKPPLEIMKQQDWRMCELVAERLVEKGILEPEKKDDFLKTITTNPEADKDEINRI